MHFIPASCRGERCTMCGESATHKVGEEIMWDDPNPIRHNLTAYICCRHFEQVMRVICDPDAALKREAMAHE